MSNEIKYILNLTLSEVNNIFARLVKFPYEEVSSLIENLKGQVTPQVQTDAPCSATPVSPAPGDAPAVPDAQTAANDTPSS